MKITLAYVTPAVPASYIYLSTTLYRAHQSTVHHSTCAYPGLNYIFSPRTSIWCLLQPTVWYALSGDCSMFDVTLACLSTESPDDVGPTLATWLCKLWRLEARFGNRGMVLVCCRVVSDTRGIRTGRHRFALIPLFPWVALL